ncbi:tetratricopeptide repeat protein [Defluviimonas salinarum]|uniref:Sel1 repeat family protein n=1 Tax=Defluviimonas salinarum TaxID=2992147 RepID=A0ABT3J978_9RHOB|nr:tetratricopeptide repeat protein [Defluviimonas salinarum]MCW3784215.1 sel1 repeat family protein [Defluviimonas salinarum]
MVRLVFVPVALGFSIAQAQELNAACYSNAFVGTHRTNMGEVQCKAPGPLYAECCFGTEACNHKLYINFLRDGSIRGVWIKSHEQGQLQFEVSEECKPLVGRRTGGVPAEDWVFKQPNANVAKNAQGCSLLDAVEFYTIRETVLECRVNDDRLDCCEIKWPADRPERYSNFDPLNPPTDIHAFESAYKREIPQCNEKSISLVFEGDGMVGWKDFTVPLEQRPKVSLPLDEQCRLKPGTILDGEERPFDLRLDFSRANVRAGDPETQFEIASFWMRQGQPRNAITHYTAAARDSHGGALLELARIFEHGRRGVDRYIEEADRLYALAAELGVKAAQQKVEQRSPVHRQIEEMVRQAESGDADRQYDLAVLYATGKAVDIDFKKALYWMEKASAQEHAPALNMLGWWYGTGLAGVPKDENASISYLERSISAGSDWALISLARVIYDGEVDVATSDYYEAQSLLWRALESSDPEVVRSARSWLADMRRDQRAVGTRNVIRQRRDQIDAMGRALQNSADAAFDALQNMK